MQLCIVILHYRKKFARFFQYLGADNDISRYSAKTIKTDLNLKNLRFQFQLKSGAEQALPGMMILFTVSD